jgi:uncharacterized membrane protein HdeD (DUF308 family)
MTTTTEKNDGGFESHRSGVRFQSIASVVLGAITGLLIALPFSISGGAIVMGALFLILGGAAGAYIGYRRRENRAFLYLCFGAILILAGTISNSFEPPSEGPKTTKAG